MIFKKSNYVVITASIISFLFLGCKDDFIVGNELRLSAFSDYMQTASQFKYDKIFLDSIDLSRLNSNIPTSRDELNSMKTVVKILNGDQSAGLKVPGFGDLTLGKKESSLSVYYIETKVVGTKVYGIGYSVHYLFRKLKRGLSITNLPKIAASVELQSKKTQVVYSLQSYGIKSLSLVNYFKPTINKDFNVEGFGVMQSSIDGIHNVLSDSILSANVNFEPMVLSLVKPTDLQ